MITAEQIQKEQEWFLNSSYINKEKTVFAHWQGETHNTMLG